MIELGVFLKVIDRSIQLLSTRQKINRDLFKDIIEPLYKEFEVISIAYVSMFRSIKNQVEESEKVDPQAILEIIYDEMLGIVYTRTQYLELAKLLSEQNKNTLVSGFSSKISEFFNASTKIKVLGDRSPTSASVPLTSYIKSKKGVFITTGSGREEILEYIREAIQLLEKRLEEIAQDYARLRLKCLTNS